MKKLVLFAVVLSLGLFCAVGCSKPTPVKKAEPAKTEVKKDEPKADAPKADEPKAEAPKPEEKK